MWYCLLCYKLRILVLECVKKPPACNHSLVECTFLSDGNSGDHAADESYCTRIVCHQLLICKST